MAYSPFTHFVENKGQSVASKFLLADSNADFEFQDGDKVVFGNGADASISWDNDNSKLKVAPENVSVEIGHASSTTTILGNLTVTGDTSYHSETIQIVENNSIQFEGTSADAHEVILTAANATADRTITLPNVAGHVALLDAAATETITSTPAELNLLDAVARGSIVYGNASAASALLAKGSANTVLSSDGTDISYTSVSNAMLAGSIADSKLNQLTTAGKVALTALEIDGATDIGEALAGADLIIVDNGAGGTNRKSTMTRVATFVLAQTASSVDIDGGNIDGVTIATSDITVGSSKTLNVSAGTLTTSAAQKQAIVSGADGAAIDNCVIGGTTVAAGSFAALAATTGTFSGVLKTDDTTDATSTTDGSLQTDGGLSVAKDAVIGDDLILLSDSSVIHFGGDKEITLSHVADTGLTLKHTATADDKPVTLTLATGETDIAADDVIGVVNFQAPDEGTGTDAVLVAAGIAAVSEGDFSSSNNATKLSFRTAASEAASEKMSLSSGGNLTVLGDIVLDDGGSLKEAGGTAAITFDGSGHVTKIGQDSPSNGEFLKYDGSKWVAAAATVSGLAADDITAGDAAVTLATSTGNITIETQANDTDIIFNVDDGGSQITALTLDGSADGAAIFKSEVQAGTQFVTAVNAASADVTAGNVKGLVAVTTADTNRTVTLPTDPTTGSTFSIKKVDSGTGRVTVTTSTNNKIDGADSVILYHQNESVTVIFAGSNNYYLV